LKKIIWQPKILKHAKQNAKVNLLKQLGERKREVINEAKPNKLLNLYLALG